MQIKVEIVKLSEIHTNPNNPRAIDKTAFEKLVKSLKEFPEMMSLREIVIDENMMILGGNMRFKALKKIGEKTAIAKIVKGLTEAQKREFIIKDNNAFGEWDWDILANVWDDLPLAEWGLEIPELPDFGPGVEEDQGKLDEKKPIVCP